MGQKSVRTPGFEDLERRVHRAGRRRLMPPGDFTHSVGVDLQYPEYMRLVMEAAQRHYVEEAYEASGGNITRAASASGLTRFYFRELLKKYGIGGR